jgi:hypothetical protein
VNLLSACVAHPDGVTSGTLGSALSMNVTSKCANRALKSCITWKIPVPGVAKVMILASAAIQDAMTTMIGGLDDL